MVSLIVTKGISYHNQRFVQEYLTVSQGYDGIGLVRELRKWLKEGSELLELGSGGGKELNLLNEYYKMTGSDYSDLFLEEIREKYPLLTCVNLNAVTLMTKEKFDCIYSNKVLPHLTKEELLMSFHRQLQVLSPKGIICHSFWNGEGKEITGDILHNYYQKEELLELLPKNFELLYFEEYKEMEKGDSLLIIAKNRTEKVNI